MLHCRLLLYSTVLREGGLAWRLLLHHPFGLRMAPSCPSCHAGLTYLNLNGCRLSGPVPPVLQAATRLQQLCLAGNAGLKLDESSVAMLSSLPALSQLELSRGQLQEAAAQLSALAPPAGKVQIIPSFMY